MTKILLVEDDKSLREIYGVRLMAEGYEITSAGDGEEALAMAIKERPMLIISDVMMPKISGFDMLDILRSTTETKDVKVIMMTALSSDDQRARGEALGADRYLVKSQVGIEDVVRTVHDVLGDGVATPQSAAQIFGTPAPSAVISPAPAPAAPAPFSPTPAPFSPPPAPMPAPTPVINSTPAPLPVAPPVINTPPAFTPEPVFTPTPIAPVPSPFQPTPNPLPQPTAPFSSSRPGSLGDRVIQPLSTPVPTADFGNLMNEELSGASIQAVAPPPPPPVPPMTPPQV
jgi:two-component system phosphate regulon response regulator PhoB